VRKTREVELPRPSRPIRPDDQLMSIGQHTLLYRARRGIAWRWRSADVFARSTDLESLQAKNARAPLEGDDADRFQEAAVNAGLCRRLLASPPTWPRPSTAMARRPTTSPNRISCSTRRRMR
jgi:hypothetical protein